MANLTRTTQDHDEIRRWAEERGGKPSHVKRTGSENDIGILRIDFPGYSGADTLEEIGWDPWFEKFDERNLALLYQEETAGGERSNFNKIVSAETAEEAEEKSHGRGGKRAASGARGAAKKSKKAAPAPSKKAAGKKSGGPSKKAAKSAGKRAATKKAPAKAAKKTGYSASKRPTKKAAGKKTAAKKTASKKRR